MYAPEIDKKAKTAELAKFGLTIEDFAADEQTVFGLNGVVIWDENWRSYELFCLLSTQWRSGINGLTGLDYNVLGELWRRLKVAVADRDYLFGDIRHMEIAVINQINEKKAANE